MWFLNYFLAKFLEILTNGLLEIGKFLRNQSVSIFRATAHMLHLTKVPRPVAQVHFVRKIS